MLDDELDLAPQTVVPGVEREERLTLEQIVAQLTPEQRDEVRDFAEFLLLRRSWRHARGGTTLDELAERHGGRRFPR